MELGFVGCNLNPDPSGGHWRSPPLTDRHWYPFYEKMVELDVPAMVHVSASCNANFHATGAHYINADTTAFMQFIEGDLFKDFPTLRFIIPHGGGAVPYHWGRYRGLADMLKRPPLREHVMRNVYFDTCVYHQPGIDLLVRVIDLDNIVFGSEMVGAVRGIDPETGHYFDDTKRYIDALPLARGRQAPNLRIERTAHLPATRCACCGSEVCEQRGAQSAQTPYASNAASGPFTMDANWLPYHPHPSRPRFVLPAGAVDAHCHVFGPGAQFPYAPERKYTPCDASKWALWQLRDRLGFSRNVIVQATCHGADNRAVVDALQSSEGRARGVATVRADVSDTELQALHAAGIRGVRFNFVKRLVDVTPREVLSALPGRVAPLGWHVVIYFEAADLPDLYGVSRGSLPAAAGHRSHGPARRQQTRGRTRIRVVY